MPAERLTMRKLKEIFRLRWGQGKSPEFIALSIGCGRTTVREYMERAKRAGLSSWIEIESLSEDELEKKLFSQTLTQLGMRSSVSTHPLPDWVKIHQELSRPGVTVQLLWQEYVEENPNGLKYSRFTELYGLWKRKLSIVMRQNHRAGEKAFVDYCDGLWLTDPQTGERRQTQLFVGALGLSSYTFVEATLSQSLPHWLMSHVKMYEFFQGVPEITVPDNLKSGVKEACYYDPEVNPSYRDLAHHYKTVVLPARVRKPRDKAKAEAAVLVAQRWILAVLRNRTFTSLHEMNGAIQERLSWLNGRTMRHVGKSRLDLWENLDRPALKALPSTRVDTIELFFKGKRVASHLRSTRRGKYTTDPAHRPDRHRAHGEWSPERMKAWAGKIGKNTAEIVGILFQKAEHPEQAYRQVLGVIRLAKAYGNDRLERAATRALALHSPAYRTLKTMLQNKMDLATPPGGEQLTFGVANSSQDKLGRESHRLVRGKGYYN